ncbi:MAG: T9SS type A sorting domain-containing protein [Candidatus Marinimicrobia bacterium]|nr:T9SS type A sorting domain-containing protein [Candidatus Neomarinimicrobiota bacterium]
MKKMLIIVMALLLTVAAFATTIRDIQFTTDASGDSPLKDQVVTVSGIVTGEPYAFGGNKMYIQDGTGPWSGIYLYMSNVNTLVADSVIISEGDSVTVTGTVAEYNGLTEIINVTALTLDSAGVGCPAPMVVPADSLNQEKYEGCLVRVKDVTISNADAGFGEWEVSDASGAVLIDDEGNAPYYFWPAEYSSCISITGLLNYSYSAYKIVPRLAWDIVEGPFTGETKIYTRMQRIQQVKASDLLKAAIDGTSDISYLVNEDTTLFVKGVVTMPTGLSYAGDGVKFLMADVHGGPWSAIMSYNADASLYPELYAGDLIEMGGYIGEYSTTPANMTEFWLVGDINILGYASLPDTAVVTTGDLRLPITAEQWGNAMVRIENSIIVDNAPVFEILEIDDGSGAVLVDDDSDSLADYISPPPMTPIESIVGWVYHHYGSYADSTTYKLEPLYKEDIVLGEGPAMILFPNRTPSNIPTSSQSVAVSATISTLRTIDTAKVFYKVNNGAYSSVDMLYAGSNIWSGTIPAQADDAIVEYYFYVVDDSSDVSALPSNHANGKLLTYKVIDGNPTIYDIQYTHAESGLSPLHGCNVVFDAYVTMDGALAANFKDDAGRGAITVASGPGAWNGVWILANPTALAAFHEGDLITVTGKVDDDHEAYWAYQTNTYVVGSAVLSINEVPIATTPVTLADLEADFEPYEGVLIEISGTSEVTSVNDYDITISDGTNSFLLDDDLVADDVFDINYNENAIVGGTDTMVATGSFSNVKGVVMYSYGTVKIEVRKLSDLTVESLGEVAISDVPEKYILTQNYPNPFNPVTTIQFDLPNASNVQMMIYDINGRLVEELANGPFNAGRYNLRWNAAHLSSGVYFCRIQTPEFTATNKMLLLK